MKNDFRNYSFFCSTFQKITVGGFVNQLMKKFWPYDSSWSSSQVGVSITCCTLRRQIFSQQPVKAYNLWALLQEKLSLWFPTK